MLYRIKQELGVFDFTKYERVLLKEYQPTVDWLFYLKGLGERGCKVRTSIQRRCRREASRADLQHFDSLD